MSELCSLDMFADNVQQGNGAIMVSADVHQEKDIQLQATTMRSTQNSRPDPIPHGPPKTKKGCATEYLIGMQKDDNVEEKRHLLSHEFGKKEEDEGNMRIPPPNNRSKEARRQGSRSAHRGRPLTTQKQLGRRFITNSKRKATKTMSGDESSSSEEADGNQVLISKRPWGMILTDEQELDVVKWLQQNEIFYNKKLSEYKDVGKKSRLLEEKAAELKVHVNQFRTWLDGMRTRFGRLCATRSGLQDDVLDGLTERDKWIYTSFQFLRPHIVRCPSRQSKKFLIVREEQAARPSTFLSQDVQVVKNEASQEINISRPPVNPSPPTSRPSSLVISRNPASSAMSPVDESQDLLEKLSEQYQQTLALQNRLLSALQPQSTHMKQVTHFMAFLRSLCETMTPAALKSFMVQAHQLALEHTPSHMPECQQPPQAPTHRFASQQCYQPNPYHPPTQQAQQQQQQIQELQEQLAALQAQATPVAASSIPAHVRRTWRNKTSQRKFERQRPPI